MAKRTDYRKVGYKTKPYSVRFDTEKFDFCMKKEGLGTAQQLVDFMMNKYWWERKMPTPTHKEAPPTELKLHTPKPTIVEPKSSYEDYLSQIMAAKTVGEIEVIMKEMEADKSVTLTQRRGLIMAAKTTGAELDPTTP